MLNCDSSLAPILRARRPRPDVLVTLGPIFPYWNTFLPFTFIIFRWRFQTRLQPASSLKGGTNWLQGPLCAWTTRCADSQRWLLASVLVATRSTLGSMPSWWSLPGTSDGNVTGVWEVALFASSDSLSMSPLSSLDFSVSCVRCETCAFQASTVTGSRKIAPTTRHIRECILIVFVEYFRPRMLSTVSR